MDIDVRFDCAGVDWAVVSCTLKAVGMASHDPRVHRTAFENSYVTVFIYRGSRLIGFGRAISDGAYQAAVYDVAVLPDSQRKGIGKTILNHILQRLPQCNVILYAAPGKEEFYRTLGFRKMKTGMALFTKPQQMTANGFTD